MIKVIQIASGSSGNAILLDDGFTFPILLDAGLTFKKLSHALFERGMSMSRIAGTLISHEHQDHSKAVSVMLKSGYSVYMSQGTWDKLKETKRYASVIMGPDIISHGKQFELEGWTILPFNVQHDAAEPMGYLIRSHKTGDKAVYIVDSAFVEYDFKGITYWIIEANYADELLAESEYHPKLKERIRRTHMSLEDLKIFFATSDLSATEGIYLIHLSDTNSDEDRFIDEIQRLTGIPTYTNLNKT